MMIKDSQEQDQLLELWARKYMRSGTQRDSTEQNSYQLRLNSSM